MTVTNCGAHFVFKQDIEDLSKTNEVDFVFYDNHLNSEVPADGTSRVEPSHDGNYIGAGPSGEGGSNDDGAGPRAGPYTRRVRQLPKAPKWKAGPSPR